MQDISSQEEDTVKLEHPLLTNPPYELSGLAQYHVTPVDQLPVIKSIQQVVLEFPHMQTTAGSPNCEAACNKFAMDMKTLGHVIELKEPELSSADQTAFQIKTRHLQQSEIVPWNQPVFYERIYRLTVPNWYYNDGTCSYEKLLEMNRMDQAALHQMVRDRVIELPEQGADLENELLCEAGEWSHPATNKIYVFPACQYGLCCVTQQELVHELKGLDRPMTLMQIMYRQEYKQFLKFGVLPTMPQRPCVLCARQALGEYVTTLRADRMHGASNKGQNFQDLSKQVLQWYRNPQNTANGYDQNFMLPAQQHEPIIHPVVTLNLAQLECKQLANGRRHIDQSSLLYVEPQEPRPGVGEQLSAF